MITMPLFGDQIHNAAVIVKRRNAYMLNKWNITKESVTAALQVVLYDTRYRPDLLLATLLTAHNALLCFSL